MMNDIKPCVYILFGVAIVSRRATGSLFSCPALSQDCSDGDIRLIGGESYLEGRVEICQSNMYSTICDDFWDESEARVVCRQLGYTGDSEFIHTSMTQYVCNKYSSHF